MSPHAFLDLCSVHGVTCMVTDAGKLRLHGPKEALDKLEPIARPIKAQVIQHLSWPRPDVLAQLGHALRVRPDTTATDTERAALVERCASLPDDSSVDALLLKLFGYWRKTTAPSLAEFLNLNRPARRGIA